MQRQTQCGQPRSDRRGGAVIVVVLTLLASLAFLGFFFYSWSDQEAKSARAFAFERIEDEDSQNYLDEALRQIIVSTPDTRAQSALHGGQITAGATINVSDKSMLAQMLGLIRADGTPEDVRPRNGRGIGVYGLAIDASGLPVANTAAEVGFDYDGDGVPDFDGTNFRLNTSAAANNAAGFANPFERMGTPLQDTRPDVDYTYPDVNSQFLAYDAVLPGGQRVIIPSFQRPQLFPNKRTAGFGDLYTDPATAAQVLRPHIEHRNADNSLRYIDPVTWPAGRPALSGDPSRVIPPFSSFPSFGSTAANQMGVFTAPGAPYDLDADADGDGVLDSIWMDLDHPIIDFADGRQAVPLYYAKIVDLDALLNVNHHGHAPLFTELSNKGTADALANIYNLTGGWIHASNLGLSPAEVNLLPALRADPNDPAYLDPPNYAAVTQQHRGWYADQSTGPPTDRTAGFTRIQMANSELARLLYGSPQYEADLSYSNPNPASDIPGRYGETVVGGSPVLRAALQSGGSAVFPSAGLTAADDDGDDNSLANDGSTAPDDNLASGIGHPDDFGGLLAPPLVIPHAVHPLDFTGLGNYPPLAVSYRPIANIGGVRDLAGLENTMPLNPSRWLYYGTRGAGGPTPAVWQNLDNGAGIATGQPTPWSRGANPTADWLHDPRLGATAYDGLWNENDEIVTDSSFPTAVDAPFHVSEVPALQLSDADWLLASTNSRLRKLASFNFEANKQAQSIRQQFTTDSRDRLEHGHARAVGANRQWEFNDDITDASRPRFPPAFDRAGAAGGPYTSRHETGIINAADPFRPVTRRLLTIEENNQANIGGSRDLPGQKLNLNRLLVNFDRNGNPIYRHLTPHATFQLGDNDANRYLTDGAGGVRPLNHAHVSYGQSYYDEGQALGLLDPDIPATGTYAAVPFAAITTDRFAQEAWARYDRQRMARDVFTLLYTLGGLDSDDITVNPNTHSGADTNGNGISDVVDAMAQFAVNYVDALDQDDCITRFEYDGNLSDGWNNPPSPAGIALGVESQQLTLSEVLLIQQPSATTDNSGTLHNENRALQVEQRWLYVELRNASPFTVPLVTGSYRLARYAPNEAGRTGTLMPVAASRFMTPTSDPANYKRIPPGENFIVACHDGQVVNGGGAPLPSDFYANIDDTLAGLEAIVPRNGTSVPGTSDNPVMLGVAPNADLDLCVTDTMVLNYSQFYRNDIVASGGVALVEPGTTNAEPQMLFQLRLERRLNTNGFEFGEDNSTWVEVDRWEVTGEAFTPTGDTALLITDAIDEVASTERRQPLDDFQTNANPATVWKHTLESVLPAKHTGNSIWAAANGGDPTVGFTLWQPHFNRDFSSVYELLSVPIVGPHQLIARISDPVNPTFPRLSGWVDSSSGTPPYAAFAAAGIFQHPDGQTPPSVSTADDNRWYRLLEFVEIPPRSHDTIRDGQALRRRTDGRINLNTLRHEAVMAGLVDDMTQLQDTSAARPALDRHDNPARNWFDQLLIARDGVDPFSSLPLPGVPGAMPFRSLTYIDPQLNDPSALEEDPRLQNTILRRHLSTAGLGLFEARGTADMANNNVDFHTRNRLLAKIANNTTNRSHVFAIWIGYEFFEAHQPNPADPDVVQIGAKITDITGHREFVVVDMTRLEEAFVDDPNDAQPGRFDFRKFIIYRKRIK